MNIFGNIYRLSLGRLLKNWYIIFFGSLTLLPILVSVLLRLNPELLLTPNPAHPDNRPAQSAPNQPNYFPSTPEYTGTQTPKTSEQLALEAEWRKDEEKLFGPRYFKRSWEEVLLGMTYYFLIGSIGVLAMASLGSRMISNEVENGTLQLLFLRPIGRCTIYLAKYTALVTAGIFLTAPAMLLVYLISYWEKLSIQSLGYDFSILLLALLAYSAVYLFISIFREGLYIALIYTMFWEIFIGFLTERARTFSVSYYIKSLYYTLFFDISQLPPNDIIATWKAVVTLLGIGIFFLSIGIALFRKQEFNFC